MTAETNMERLDWIKKIARRDELATRTGPKPITILNPVDYKFLLEQAERALGFERLYDEQLEEAQKTYDHLKLENARLREALKEVFELSKHDGHSHYLDKCYVVSSQALKGAFS